MRYLIAIFVLVLLGSCGSDQIDLGISGKYLPKQSLLKKGLVWKYYVHIDKDGQEVETDIEYFKYQLIDGKLMHEIYNVGFQLQNRIVYSIDDGDWKIEQYQIFVNDRLVEGLLNKPGYLNWNKQESQLEIEFDQFESMLLTENQTSRTDTLIKREEAVMFQSKGRSIFENEEHITIREFRPKLGVFSIREIYETLKKEWVLEEVMMLEEFHNKMNHGIRKVAHIYPEQTLQTNTVEIESDSAEPKAPSAFATCDPIDLILYYYHKRNDCTANNCKDSGFLGGKGALKKYLKETVDLALLENESGYLTFRFIINCYGIAGHFVTEEVDLNFEEKRFNSRTRDHLFNLLSSVKRWQALLYPDQYRDSYAYVTFKLKNGAIVEILP